MTKSEIFKMAWSLSRHAVKMFGGKAKEYFSESLKIAYAKHREESRMTMRDYLLAAGGKDWFSAEKYGNQHRVYPSMRTLVEALGLVWSPCSLNGWQVWFRGKEISLAQAKAAKRVLENGSFWYDVGAQDFFFDKMRTDYGNAIAKTLLENFKAAR